MIWSLDWDRIKSHYNLHRGLRFHGVDKDYFFHMRTPRIHNQNPALTTAPTLSTLWSTYWHFELYLDMLHDVLPENLSQSIYENNSFWLSSSSFAIQGLAMSRQQCSFPRISYINIFYLLTCIPSIGPDTGIVYTCFRHLFLYAIITISLRWLIRKTVATNETVGGHTGKYKSKKVIREVEKWKCTSLTYIPSSHSLSLSLSYVKSVMHTLQFSFSLR